MIFDGFGRLFYETKRGTILDESLYHGCLWMVPSPYGQQITVGAESIFFVTRISTLDVVLVFSGIPINSGGEGKLLAGLQEPGTIRGTTGHFTINCV